MQQSGRSNLLDSAAAFLTDFVPPCIYGLCQVCGAEATGIHYAASTCEGCKGFFKRSLPVYRSYKCFFGGSCHIIPETRGRCKACRFQKCLQAGMSPDGNRNRGKGKATISLDAKPGTSSEHARPPLRHQQKFSTLTGQQQSVLTPVGPSALSPAPTLLSRDFSNQLSSPHTPASSSASMLSSLAVAGAHAQLGRHVDEGHLHPHAASTAHPSRSELQMFRTESNSGYNANTLNLPTSSSLSLSPSDDSSTRHKFEANPTLHASSSMGNIFNYAESSRYRHLLTSSHTSHPLAHNQQQEVEYSPPVIIASGRAFDQQQNASVSPISLHTITPNADSVLDMLNQDDGGAVAPQSGLSSVTDAAQNDKAPAHVMLPLQRQLALTAKPVENDAVDDHERQSANTRSETYEVEGALSLKINQLIDSFDSVVCSSIVCHLYTEWANQWMPNLLTARYNKHYLGNNLLYQPVVSISHYMAAFMKAITEYDEEMEHYAVAIPGMKALDAHVGYELRSHSCLSTFCVTFCEVLAEEESYYAFQCQDSEHTHWLSQTNYWFAALTPAGALPIFWHMTAYFRSLKLNDVVRALVVAAIIARSRGNDHLPAFVRSALPVTYFGHFKVKPNEWAPAEQVFSFLMNVISSHLSREYPDRHEHIMRNLHNFFSNLALKLDVLDELMLQSIPFGFNEDGTFDWQRLLRFNLNDDIIPIEVRRWLRAGWDLVE